MNQKPNIILDTQLLVFCAECGANLDASWKRRYSYGGGDCLEEIKVAPCLECLSRLKVESNVGQGEPTQAAS